MFSTNPSLPDFRDQRAVLSAKQGEVIGPVPTIANRHSYLFRRLRNLESWVLFRGPYTLSGSLEVSWLKHAAHCLVAHHDGLRLQVRIISGDWFEEIVPIASVSPFLSMDRSAVATREALLDASAVVKSNFSFPGELFRVVHVRTRERECVFFACHHLLADAVSMNIIEEDFFRTYASLAKGQENQLPPKATSYQDYCTGSLAYWLSKSEEEATYWRSLPWERSAPLVQPHSGLIEYNTEQHTKQSIYVTRFDKNHLARIQQLFGWRHAEVILAAIAKAYCTVIQTDSVLSLALVVHGRESFLAQADLSRTVGWISETVPLLLDGKQQWNDLLDEVRAQVRKAIYRGKSFGILRYCRNPTILKHPSPDVSLNMKLGRQRTAPDNCFYHQNEFPLAHNELASTQRVFVLSGGVYFNSQDKLVVSWDFSDKVMSPARVASFAQACVRCLEEITDEIERGRPI